MCRLWQYCSMLERESEYNRFRACFYNKVDQEKLNLEAIKFLNEHVPSALIGDDGTILPVDLHKWLDVAEANPDKEKLSVTQIGSVSELKQRMDVVLESVKKTRERLQASKDHLSVVQVQCESDLQQSLDSACSNNALIK